MFKTRGGGGVKNVKKPAPFANDGFPNALIYVPPPGLNPGILANLTTKCYKSLYKNVLLRFIYYLGPNFFNVTCLAERI